MAHASALTCPACRTMRRDWLCQPQAGIRPRLWTYCFWQWVTNGSAEAPSPLKDYVTANPREECSESARTGLEGQFGWALAGSRSAVPRWTCSAWERACSMSSPTWLS